MTKFFVMLMAVVTMFAGLSSASVANEPKPVGTVVIDETQFAFIVSGQGGGGTLNFQGQAIPFQIGGLGVGGVGISEIKAVGEVYNLTSVAQFFGTYATARAGWAIGRMSGGHLWLENTDGVILHLNAEREGLILSLGADALIISQP